MEIVINNINEKKSYVWFTLPIDYDNYKRNFITKLENVHHEVINDGKYGTVITFPEDFLNEVCSVIMTDSKTTFQLMPSGTGRDNLLHLYKVENGEVVKEKKETKKEEIKEVEDKENEVSKVGKNIIKISKSPNFRNKANVKAILESYQEYLDCNITVHYTNSSKKSYKDLPQDTLHIFLWSAPSDLRIETQTLRWVDCREYGNKHFNLRNGTVYYVYGDGSNLHHNRHILMQDGANKVIYAADNAIYFLFDIDGFEKNDFCDLFKGYLKEVIKKYNNEGMKPEVLKHVDLFKLTRKIILDDLGYTPNIDLSHFKNIMKTSLDSTLVQEEKNLKDYLINKDHYALQFMEQIKHVEDCKRRIKSINIQIGEDDSKTIEKQIERIKLHKLVENVGISKDKKYFLIKTNHLVTYKLSDGKQRDLGEYIIKIPVDYRKEPKIKIENLTRVCGVPPVPFPHFETSQNALCLGNISATIIEYLSTYQFDVTADLLLEFLQTINEKDVYGERYKSWPIYDPSKELTSTPIESDSTEKAPMEINTIINMITTNDGVNYNVCDGCGNNEEDCVCDRCGDCGELDEHCRCNICDDCGNHYDDCTCSSEDD